MSFFPQRFSHTLYYSLTRNKYDSYIQKSKEEANLISLSHIILVSFKNRQPNPLHINRLEYIRLLNTVKTSDKDLESVVLTQTEWLPHYLVFYMYIYFVYTLSSIISCVYTSTSVFSPQFFCLWCTKQGFFYVLGKAWLLSLLPSVFADLPPVVWKPLLPVASCKDQNNQKISDHSNVGGNCSDLVKNIRT